MANNGICGKGPEEHSGKDNCCRARRIPKSQDLRHEGDLYVPVGSLLPGREPSPGTDQQSERIVYTSELTVKSHKLL
jgi:hypothetical protein